MRAETTVPRCNILQYEERCLALHDGEARALQLRRLKIFKNLIQLARQKGKTIGTNLLKQIFANIDKPDTPDTPTHIYREFLICRRLQSNCEKLPASSIDCPIWVELLMLIVDCKALCNQHYIQQPFYQFRNKIGSLQVTEPRLVHDYSNRNIELGATGKEPRQATPAHTTPIVRLKSVHVGPSTDHLRQRQLGECFIVSTLQAIRATNPEALRQLFRIQPDGTIIGRVFIRNHRNKLVKQYLRFDPTDIHTVDRHGKRHRTYHAHKSSTVCIVEKLVALAQMHEDKINHKQPNSLIHYLSHGTSRHVFTTLFATSIEQEKFSLIEINNPRYFETLNNSMQTHFGYNYQQIRAMIDLYNRVYKRHLKLIKGHNVAATIEYQDIVATLKIPEVFAETCIQEFEQFFNHPDDAALTRLKNPIQSFTACRNLLSVLESGSEPLLPDTNIWLPPKLRLIADKFATYLRPLNPFKPTPKDTCQTTRTPEQQQIYTRLRGQLYNQQYVTAHTETDFQIQGGAVAAEYAEENKTNGFASRHLYAILDVCTRRDVTGKEYQFVRVSNPWGEYYPQYTKEADGTVRRHQTDSPRARQQSHEEYQRMMFGPITDCANPTAQFDENSAEVLLDDFCCYWQEAIACSSVATHRPLMTLEWLSVLLKAVKPEYHREKKLLATVNLLLKHTDKHQDANNHIRVVMIQLRQFIEEAEHPMHLNVQMQTLSHTLLQCITASDAPNHLAITQLIQSIIATQKQAIIYSDSNIKKKLPKGNSRSPRGSQQLWLQIVTYCYEQLISDEVVDIAAINFLLTAAEFQMKSQAEYFAHKASSPSGHSTLQTTLCQVGLMAVASVSAGLSKRLNPAV